MVCSLRMEAQSSQQHWELGCFLPQGLHPKFFRDYSWIPSEIHPPAMGFEEREFSRVDFLKPSKYLMLVYS